MMTKVIELGTNILQTGRVLPIVVSEILSLIHVDRSRLIAALQLKDWQLNFTINTSIFILSKFWQVVTLIELWGHENEHIVHFVLNVNIFSSPEPKAKVSFSIKMCSLSVVIIVINFSQINFFKTLEQFQPNLAISSFE